MPVAIPDKTRKSIPCLEIKAISFVSPLKKVIPQVNIKMTTVRIAVARSELIFFNPIFAKIVVKAAKIADNNA